MASAEQRMESDVWPAERRTAAIRYWLIAVAVLVFAMVLLGGATRLTDSGLSITEWQPIMGAIPPMSEAAWDEAFAKYRQIPEYQQINRGMSLADFKTIYWWEWSHRFLGRFIGLAFFIPFLVFWLKGWLSPGLRWKLLGVLVLGALQGLMGWYMVMSGLVTRVDVSQYRLAAHLGLAAVILAAILWLVFDLGARPLTRSAAMKKSLFFVSTIGLTVLIFIQIIVGAFVAGLDAGYMYNSWPLIDGHLIPEGLSALDSLSANLFENPLTVQFNHRMIAYLAVLWGALHCWVALRQPGKGEHKKRAAVLAAGLVAQALLGIWALLAVVPLDLALAHQAGAFIVFALALFHLHGFKSAKEDAP